MSSPKKKIAVVGSGPAGLMAATQLCSFAQVTLFEKRPSLGRKLLIAGSSGLNISHQLSEDDFARHYDRPSFDFWKRVLAWFSPQAWIFFIEKELGLETFLGTSDRYFVREMKASNLLKRWTEYLRDKGVEIRTASELTDFEERAEGVRLTFSEKSEVFDFGVFAFGGGSWEAETPAWVNRFKEKGLEVKEFEPSNVGFELAWSAAFLREAEGKPLKKVVFTTSRGSKGGELVVTRYGLEGTPLYFYGAVGSARIDLKPDLSLPEIVDRLKNVKENLSPIRRVKKTLNLGEASLALLFHHTPQEVKNDLLQLSGRIKDFPLQLLRPRPLSEAISSRGGVPWSELNENLQLKKFPRLYCAGEMMDWDAPTGGFLIQGSVSMGAWVANQIKNKVSHFFDSSI